MRATIIRSTLIAALGTLLVASGVLAARPTRNPPPTSFDDFLLDANSGNCAFEVNVHVDVNREYETVWDNPDGSTDIEFTGAIKLTLTNVSTGASVAVNSSSAARLELDADGNPTRIQITGLTVGYFQPSIILYAGQLDDVTGTFHGTTTDLCAALSS
jgi:hypothetical protein